MSSAVATGFLRSVQVSVALLAATGLYGIIFPKQTILKDNAKYDYIVVGAGTAGCVIARRLVESRQHRVLLLEAGPNPPFTALLPEFFDLLPASYVDYKYTSTRDRYAAAGQGGRTMLTAGKMLGGSASLNHYIYLRGTSKDYDSWAKISKDNSWKYENILKYFIKGERNIDEKIVSTYPEYHGTEGPIGVGRQTFDDEVKDYMESFAEAGNPTVLDLTADINTGYTQPLFTVADKKRQTPALSYLKPVKDYSNLYLSRKTRVTKIIFKGNVAVGVKAVHLGKTYTLRAKKEIIICAGVYNTPKLLLLSGIGPKNHLNSMNIRVKSNLPVGKNMRDHVAVTLVHKVKPYIIPLPAPGSFLLDPTKIPFPYIVGSVALNKSESRPDYQTYSFILQHDTWYLTLVCKAFFGYRDDICDRFQKGVKSRDSMYTTLSHMKPLSTGHVRLASRNPKAKPRITTGYYKNKEDLDDMIKYVKDFLKVDESTYFKEIGAGLVGLKLPECKDKNPGSDDFWRCYILTMTCSPYDTVGTCAMGAVVDGKLKVKRFKNLRIADASIMPTLPRGRVSAIVNMIAEKASDMILNDS